MNKLGPENARLGTECESVGTVYMLPAKVYRQQPGMPTPPIHFPTAFTEHYPVRRFGLVLPKTKAQDN